MIRNYGYMFGTRGPDVRGSYAAQRPFKRSLNVLVSRPLFVIPDSSGGSLAQIHCPKNFSDTHETAHLALHVCSLLLQSLGFSFLCCCTKVEKTRRNQSWTERERVLLLTTHRNFYSFQCLKFGVGHDDDR